eukprot:TRINITY_DN5744_c0_g2_i1.p1 TRINITY_DN5744_c0_g2~~TRINITY_DN5744_c0_g2_i1.p1  ORF type:complete len:112 (+),score=11.96 TRINITY_DN5744_c0_g2_i1:823-1158(+)
MSDVSCTKSRLAVFEFIDQWVPLINIADVPLLYGRPGVFSKKCGPDFRSDPIVSPTTQVKMLLCFPQIQAWDSFSPLGSGSHWSKSQMPLIPRIDHGPPTRCGVLILDQVH